METWSTIPALDITLKAFVIATLLGLLALALFFAFRNMVRDPRKRDEVLTNAIFMGTMLLSPIPDALGITEDGFAVFTAIVCTASVLFTSLFFGWWDRRRGRQ